jgi:hypothetical protein
MPTQTGTTETSHPAAENLHASYGCSGFNIPTKVMRSVFPDAATFPHSCTVSLTINGRPASEAPLPAKVQQYKVNTKAIQLGRQYTTHRLLGLSQPLQAYHSIMMTSCSRLGPDALAVAVTAQGRGPDPEAAGAPARKKRKTQEQHQQQEQQGQQQQGQQQAMHSKMKGGMFYLPAGVLRSTFPTVTDFPHACEVRLEVEVEGQGGSSPLLVAAQVAKYPIGSGNWYHCLKGLSKALKAYHQPVMTSCSRQGDGQVVVTITAAAQHRGIKCRTKVRKGTFNIGKEVKDHAFADVSTFPHHCQVRLEASSSQQLLQELVPAVLSRFTSIGAAVGADGKQYSYRLGGFAAVLRGYAGVVMTGCRTEGHVVVLELELQDKTAADVQRRQEQQQERLQRRRQQHEQKLKQRAAQQQPLRQQLSRDSGGSFYVPVHVMAGTFAGVITFPHHCQVRLLVNGQQLGSSGTVAAELMRYKLGGQSDGRFYQHTLRGFDGLLKPYIASQTVMTGCSREGDAVVITVVAGPPKREQPMCTKVIGGHVYVPKKVMSTTFKDVSSFPHPCQVRVVVQQGSQKAAAGMPAAGGSNALLDCFLTTHSCNSGHNYCLRGLADAVRHLQQPVMTGCDREGEVVVLTVMPMECWSRRQRQLKLEQQQQQLAGSRRSPGAASWHLLLSKARLAVAVAAQGRTVGAESCAAEAPGGASWQPAGGQDGAGGGDAAGKRAMMDDRDELAEQPTAQPLCLQRLCCRSTAGWQAWRTLLHSARCAVAADGGCC